MGREVAKTKPAVKTASKPVVHAWRNRLPQPWSTFCDCRAVVAAMIRLYELERKRCFTLDRIIDFITEGDLGCLPSRRRMDIVEGFYNRNDVRNIVHLVVIFLLKERVLIFELEDAHDDAVYRMNVEEVCTLNNYHVAAERKSVKLPKLKVVP